jgi:hypothetical protein
MLAASASVDAQILPYKIEGADSYKEITSGGSAKFAVTITNQTTEPLKIYVLRTTNAMPDPTWLSAICFGGACYAPETDAPDPVTLQPGEPAFLELTVTGYGDPGTTGRVNLRVTTILGSNPVEKEFTAVIGGSSSVELENKPIVLDPVFPNPASTYASIPLPTFAPMQNVSLELVDIRGNRVADLSSSARQAIQSGAQSVGVNLGGLQSGTYFYRLSANGKTSVGSFVVAR